MFKNPREIANLKIHCCSFYCKNAENNLQTMNFFIMRLNIPAPKLANWLNKKKNFFFVPQANCISAGQLLCGGLFSADSLSNWCAAVALAHALQDNLTQKEQLLRVQLATSLGKPPVSLLQQCTNILSQVGRWSEGAGAEAEFPECGLALGGAFCEGSWSVKQSEQCHVVVVLQGDKINRRVSSTCELAPLCVFLVLGRRLMLVILAWHV